LEQSQQCLQISARSSTLAVGLQGAAQIIVVVHHQMDAHLFAQTRAKA
jgi:hypothetical protein